MIVLENVRDQFPALKDRVFLDAACVSVTPRAAIEAVEQFLDLAVFCPGRSATDHHLTMDAMRAAARPEAARLIGATETEIALVESTTHGLTLAADAIPLEPGDRVLLSDLEFLQVAVPWYQKRDQLGVEIDFVPHRDGQVTLDDVVERITPRTRVVAMSTVQWASGFRCDLSGLVSVCRERGVWLVVDAIQQLGAVPIDVRQAPVDFLACGGHKWLNAPFGCGFLYVRAEVMDRLRPPLAGYLSLETPTGGWGEYFQTPAITPDRHYGFVPEARRFEIGGTANYPGAVGLAASLRMFNEIGPARIADHIEGLTSHLITGLQKLGLDVVTPLDWKHRAGIVTFDAGSRERNAALLEHLLDANVLVSMRYTSHVGGLRVSCHLFNNTDDLDALLSRTAWWLQDQKSSTAS